MSAISPESSLLPCSPLRRVTSSNRSRSCSMPLWACISTRSSKLSSSSTSIAARFSRISSSVFSSCSGPSPAPASSGPAASCSSGALSASRSACAAAHKSLASARWSDRPSAFASPARWRWHLYRRHKALALVGSIRTASLSSLTARRHHSCSMSAWPRLECSTERTCSTVCTSATRIGLPSACSHASSARCHAASASACRFFLNAALPSSRCSST
mmetsp:Transcript_42639/g.102476  ORF Transcript_42639/g.102476 Transcript_42639/m.102476 type:complete len:216 (-) Transcript_42639:55-702(-)